jgi:formyltetrahydrofolate deformylase
VSHDSGFILCVACPDRIGVVAAVSTYLAESGLFITESSHYGDPDTGLFFMRAVFAPTRESFTRAGFSGGFEPLAARYGLTWHLYDARVRPNVVILVSRFDHCLNDLLYRHRIGALDMAVPAIVSNHMDCAWLAERHGIPYFHVPVTRENKANAERRILEIAEDAKADLVVLARYMQILSDETCAALEGRAINIHHSFLPSFKGAKPYHQAYERGVKIIGATAHYVTQALDEGPIIAQAVEPVSHRHKPDDMVAIGRDIESRVLAQAVKLHIERRIFINGHKTVVLD